MTGGSSLRCLLYVESARNRLFHDSLNRRMDMLGFSGYEEMNAHMIRQWNEHVTKKDEVYILKEDVKKQITNQAHRI